MLYDKNKEEGYVMEEFNERLIDLVKKSQFTQKELAGMIGVTEAAMSQYLSGSREPKLGVIANLATALNTTTDYLINGVKDENIGYKDVYRFVTRSSKDFSDEEKMKLIRELSK